MGTVLGLALLLGYAPQAGAGALLRITTGGFSATCDNTQAITAFGRHFSGGLRPLRLCLRYSPNVHGRH